MASKLEWNRRKFIKGAAVLGAAPLIRWRQHGAATVQRNRNRFPMDEVPKKPLGRTGVQVSAMGLGGYHLGSAETDQAANGNCRQSLRSRRPTFSTTPGNITTASAKSASAKR